MGLLDKLELTRNVQGVAGVECSRPAVREETGYREMLQTLAKLVMLVMTDCAAPQQPGGPDSKGYADGDSGSLTATHKARVLISVSRQSIATHCMLSGTGVSAVLRRNGNKTLA